MNHSYRVTFTLAALLILVSGLGTVFAQEDPRLWDENGVAVRQGLHLFWQRQTATNDDGSTCVVWTDARSGLRTVYTQIIDTDGNLLLGNQGVFVAESDIHQVDPVVTTVNDGWIIAWLSHSSWHGEGTYQAESIFAQKIDLNGALQWSDSGVEVYYDPESSIGEATLQIVPDENGGVIVAWEDARRGDIAAAHITADGVSDWESVLYVTDLQYYQNGLHTASDGQGNMIAAWNDQRVTNNQNIYGAKIMADGTLPWGDGVNGILICSYEYWQSSVSLCTDYSSSGVYCAWLDHRPAGNEDLYIQRISGDGTMLWQENGIPLCDAPDKQFYVRLAVSLNDGVQDGVIAVWEDLRINGFVYEVYAQKVDPAGVMLWGENGRLVCGNAGPNTTGETRDNARAISDFSGGAYVSWDDTRDVDGNILKYDLYAARLSAEGDNLWSECGELVQGGLNAQQSAAMTFNEQASALEVVYIDESQGSQVLEHQRLAANDGSALLETENELLVSLDGDATYPQVVQISEGKAGMAWMDNRGWSTGKAIYYQIVGTEGEFELPMNGAMVAPDNTEFDSYRQQSPVVTADGDGGFFTAFEDVRTGTRQVRLSRINEAGEVVSDPAGVVVHEYPLDQQNPLVCPDGSGGCFVAWQAHDLQFTLDVYIQHCDENCNPLWDNPIQLTTDGTYDDLLKALISSNDCCILIWETGDWDANSVRTARISADGEIDWNQAIAVINNYWSNPSACEDGIGGVFIMWTDERSQETGQDIFAQYLSVNGEPLWQDNGIPIVTEANQQSQPTPLYSPEYGLYVVWEDFRNGQHIDIYAQKVDLSGNLLWDASGLLLCGELNDQEDVSVSLNENGGIFAVWRDYRSGYSQIYGTNLLPTGLPAGDWWIEGSGGVICEVGLNQITPVVTPMSTEQTLIAWTDWRSTTAEPMQDIYTQSVDVGTISAEDEPSEFVPSEYALRQNYPNPFNPSTTISFSIPKAGYTSLVVYDLLGRSVETLINKPLTAGSYHVSWNAGALPSGVYFYRLTAGEFSDVKKTVLLK